MVEFGPKSWRVIGKFNWSNFAVQVRIGVEQWTKIIQNQTRLPKFNRKTNIPHWEHTLMDSTLVASGCGLQAGSTS